MAHCGCDIGHSYKTEQIGAILNISPKQRALNCSALLFSRRRIGEVYSGPYSRRKTTAMMRIFTVLWGNAPAESKPHLDILLDVPRYHAGDAAGFRAPVIVGSGLRQSRGTIRIRLTSSAARGLVARRRYSYPRSLHRSCHCLQPHKRGYSPRHLSYWYMRRWRA
jgi:hypothetical protein